MRCAICKVECGRTICSESCRALLADKVAEEMRKRNTSKRHPIPPPYINGTKRGGGRKTEWTKKQLHYLAD
jgi:hypothetical protein